MCTHTEAPGGSGCGEIGWGGHDGGAGITKKTEREGGGEWRAGGAAGGDGGVGGGGGKEEGDGVLRDAQGYYEVALEIDPAHVPTLVSVLW